MKEEGWVEAMPCLKEAEFIDERFKQKRNVTRRYWAAHDQQAGWRTRLGKWDRQAMGLKPWSTSLHGTNTGRKPLLLLTFGSYYPCSLDSGCCFHHFCCEKEFINSLLCWLLPNTGAPWKSLGDMSNWPGLGHTLVSTWDTAWVMGNATHLLWTGINSWT